MKATIYKILSVLITCFGVVFSIIEQNPLGVGGFVLGGFISYELATIIENDKK